MPSVDDIFQKQFEYIDELISENKLKEAYEACGGVLRADPINKKAKKYQTHVERLIDEHNREFVKKEIEKLQLARKSGRLKEVTAAAEKLVQMFPADQQVLDYLAEVQKEYRKQFEKEQADKYKDFKRQIEDLIKNSKLDDALGLCYQFVKENPADKLIAYICRQERIKIVEEKLRAMKDLFKTDKYEEILNALYSLKKIEETPRLKDLIIDYTSRLRDRQVEEKHDFILKAKDDILYLFQMAKYSECINAAQELLRIDSKNSFAKNIIPRAQKRLDKQARSEVFKQMDAQDKQNPGA